MVVSSGYAENHPALRTALRRTRIAAREALPADSHRALSQRIAAHLEALLLQHTPTSVGFCWPIRAEFDARPVIERVLSLGWQACLPVVVALGAPMLFRAWTPGCAMNVDLHGIPHPLDGGIVHPHVLLIPVNACDQAGYRLGYGGGYFDRTLAAAVPRPLTIGVGFELCRVPTIYPQEHDIPLDRLVTEEQCYNFTR